jgi:hypothetical protein
MIRRGLVQAGPENAPAIVDEQQRDEIAEITEQIKQHIREPGTDGTATVMDLTGTDRLGKTRVCLVEREQGKGQKDGNQCQDDDTDLLDIADHLPGRGRGPLRFLGGCLRHS